MVREQTRLEFTCKSKMNDGRMCELNENTNLQGATFAFGVLARASLRCGGVPLWRHGGNLVFQPSLILFDQLEDLSLLSLPCRQAPTTSTHDARPARCRRLLSYMEESVSTAQVSGRLS